VSDDAPAPCDRVLRVMTWNVRDMLGDPWAVRRVLLGARPDVVCLQEGPRVVATRHQLGLVARRAGLTFVAGGRRGAGTAVLVGRRAVVHGAAAHRLPVRGWRTRPRGCVRALVSLPATAPLAVTCLHLGLDERERARHVELLLAAQPVAGGPPVVLAGDLNERPDGASWRSLAARAADPAPGAPATFRSARPRLRIDAVLVDPALEVRSYGFPDGVTEADVVAASDHRPVLAEVVLPRL
jgi:endonuclease/exonuclease/phosphatase family metal-dependent hydrolase